MVRIAIVEDDQSAAKVLKDYINKYAKNKNEEFSLKWFCDAESFLSSYNSDFDLILMDIEMPGMNGMEAAHKVREIDKTVTIIFVTNMAQFAVKGYEVDAIDFIVKPVEYFDFEMKLSRALNKIRLKIEKEISLTTDSGLVRIFLSRLKYVEVMKHRIIYHTVDGDYKTFGSLNSVEELIDDKSFVKCNRCYLVNLRFVTSIKGYTATVGEEELQISQSKRKSFITAVTDYIGGGL